MFSRYCVLSYFILTFCFDSIISRIEPWALACPCTYFLTLSVDLHVAKKIMIEITIVYNVEKYRIVICQVAWLSVCLSVYLYVLS